MSRFVLLCCAVPLMLSSSARADVVDVSGKILAVDTEERTISVQGNMLEVPKKCPVVVDGEAAELADLKQGQVAVVKYDDALEIALSITAGEMTDNEEVTAINLFNGKNLSGWDFLGDEKKINQSWSVKSGGVLQCSGADDAAPLLTDEKYKNFTLTLEWRFPPGVTPSKDGVGVAVRMDRSSGKQVRYQLQDGANAFLWAIDQSDSPKALLGTPVNGTKQPLIKGPKAVRKPLGEWNVLSVVCDGEEVSVEQNGEETIHLKGVDAVSGYVGFIPAKTKVEIRKIVLTPK